MMEFFTGQNVSTIYIQNPCAQIEDFLHRFFFFLVSQILVSIFCIISETILSINKQGIINHIVNKYIS